MKVRPRSEKKNPNVKNEIITKENKENNRKRKSNSHENKFYNSEDEFETKKKRSTRNSLKNAIKIEDAHVKSSAKAEIKSKDLKQFERVQPTQLKPKIVKENIKNNLVKNDEDMIMKDIKKNEKIKVEKNKCLDVEDGIVFKKAAENKTSKVIETKADNIEHDKDENLNKKKGDFTKLKKKSDIINLDKENKTNKRNTRSRQNKKSPGIEDDNEKYKNNQIKSKMKMNRKTQKQVAKLEKKTSKKPTKIKTPKSKEDDVEYDDDEEEEDDEEDNNDNDLIDEDYQPNDEDDENDWEEVKAEEPGLLMARVQKGGGKKSNKTTSSIQVTVQDTKKRKPTKAEMFHDAVRCAINRSRSTAQQNVHQIHILCMMSHGRTMSLKACNDQELQAVLLSLTPALFVDKQDWNPHSLVKFVSWFRGKVSCLKEDFVYDYGQISKLVKALVKQVLDGEVKSAFEHILLMVACLRSMGLKTRLMHAFEPVTMKASDLIKRSSKPANLMQEVFGKNYNGDNVDDRDIAGDDKEKVQNAVHENNLTTPTQVKSESKSSKSSTKKDKKKNKNDTLYESEDEEDDEDLYDDYYYKKNTKKSSAEGKKDKSVTSRRKGLFHWWAEVFLPSQQKWIYVNSVTEKVGGVEDVRENVTLPYLYALAHDDNGHVKDLTSKYDENWLVKNSKRRLPGDWWTVMMMIFKDNQSVLDTVEDVQINDMLMNVPLPTNFAAFKNHPFYVIGRHLLKYEVLVPKDPPILGHVKGEPVYARSAVHTCHSKDKWMLEGRVVKKGEEAYKVVKAIRRQNEPEGLVRWQYLFGRWQTEKYIPPPICDGKVPKNRFGNIELFQPWMVPPGGVYIRERMLGLDRVAKQHGKDAAPAMLGWHFKKGFNIPIVRGWVVCKEDKDFLVSEWWKQQKQLIEKMKEKKRKAVLLRWRRMTLALLNRDRLMKKYQVKF